MRFPVPLLLLAAAALADEPRVIAQRFVALQQEAFGYYNAKDYGKAVAAFERQIAAYPDNPTPYYNIACCYALQGNAERAGTWLLISIQRGWRDARHLARDPDFDRIRQSPEYLHCLSRLKEARAADPDPMPGDVAPGSVPRAPSVSAFVTLSQLQERAVREMRVLYDVHRFRTALFEVLDRRMAVLARYILENGDAADAAEAAVARVGTAALYLAEAEGQGEPDRALRRAGADAVLRTSEEFLRGYPGDPRLPNVLLARAIAFEALGRDDDAIAILLSVRADHPAAAPRAEVELCGLLPAGEELEEVYDAVRAKLGREGVPLRARLLCEGMPQMTDFDMTDRARVDAHEGILAYVFVASGEMESERMLAGLPPASGRFLPVVVPVGIDRIENDAWLAAHGRGLPAILSGAAAAERVWLEAVPLVVVARKDGTVLAVGPDAAELAKLAAE